MKVMLQEQAEEQASSDAMSSASEGEIASVAAELDSWRSARTHFKVAPAKRLSV